MAHSSVHKRSQTSVDPLTFNFVSSFNDEPLFLIFHHPSKSLLFHLISIISKPFTEILFGAKKEFHTKINLAEGPDKTLTIKQALSQLLYYHHRENKLDYFAYSFITPNEPAAAGLGSGSASVSGSGSGPGSGDHDKNSKGPSPSHNHNKQHHPDYSLLIAFNHRYHDIWSIRYLLYGHKYTAFPTTSVPGAIALNSIKPHTGHNNNNNNIIYNFNNRVGGGGSEEENKKILNEIDEILNHHQTNNQANDNNIIMHLNEKEKEKKNKLIEKLNYFVSNKNISSIKLNRSQVNFLTHQLKATTHIIALYLALRLILLNQSKLVNELHVPKHNHVFLSHNIRKLYNMHEVGGDYTALTKPITVDNESTNIQNLTNFFKFIKGQPLIDDPNNILNQKEVDSLLIHNQNENNNLWNFSSWLGTGLVNLTLNNHEGESNITNNPNNKLNTLTLDTDLLVSLKSNFVNNMFIAFDMTDESNGLFEEAGTCGDGGIHLFLITDKPPSTIQFTEEFKQSFLDDAHKLVIAPAHQ